MTSTETLNLYTRPGCGLCDDMARVLAPVARELGLEVEAVDISRHPALVTRYGWDIPVVCLGEAEVIRHRATKDELRQRLQVLLAEPSRLKETV